MPFEIVRNDIANMQVDAIVNPASRRVRINPGVDMAIHRKAGPGLLEARRAVGDIAVGDAAVTPAFGLAARVVIHAPSPIWLDGAHGEAGQLKKIYERCLALALENGCESVAFPLMAAGSHGFPKDVAMKTAIGAFGDFLMDHDMHIYLVVFGPRSFALSGKLVQNVKSYIDENYVENYEQLCYGANARRMQAQRYAQRRLEELEAESARSAPVHPEPARPAPVHSEPAPCSLARAEIDDDLTGFLRKKDAGFAVTLVELIERSGRKNPEVYKKANVDKKLFSKIINNVNYHPNKQTAVAFAMALELDLEQTRDLIGRAGYALTHSSRFDLVIEYCIMKKNYNVFEINEVLFELDLPLLGC